MKKIFLPVLVAIGLVACDDDASRNNRIPEAPKNLKVSKIIETTTNNETETVGIEVTEIEYGENGYAKKLRKTYEARDEESTIKTKTEVVFTYTTNDQLSKSEEFGYNEKEEKVFRGSKSYIYNKKGLVTSKTETYFFNTGKQISQTYSYEYNDKNWLTKESSNEKNIVTYTYDNTGKLNKRAAQTVTTTYSFDNNQAPITTYLPKEVIVTMAKINKFPNNLKERKNTKEETFSYEMTYSASNILTKITETSKYKEKVKSITTTEYSYQ